MSNEALQQVIDTLQSLPEADQEMVLNFLTSVKQRHDKASAVAGAISNKALLDKNGLLVFTGTLEDSRTDWLRQERDEREQELMRIHSARSSR